MSILDHCEKISNNDPSSELSSILGTEKDEPTALLILTYSDNQSEGFHLEDDVAVKAMTEIVKAIEDGEPKMVHIHSSKYKDQIVIFLDQIPRTVRVKHVGSLPDFQ